MPVTLGVSRYNDPVFRMRRRYRTDVVWPQNVHDADTVWYASILVYFYLCTRVETYIDTTSLWLLVPETASDLDHDVRTCTIPALVSRRPAGNLAGDV